MHREITDHPTIETVYKELLALGDRVEQIYRILERWTDKNHLDSVVNYYKNQIPPKNDTDPQFDRLVEKMWQDIKDDLNN